MFASCWFSHQGDAALVFARHRRSQAPTKVDVMEADEEFLFAFLDVFHISLIKYFRSQNVEDDSIENSHKIPCTPTIVTNT